MLLLLSLLSYYLVVLWLSSRRIKMYIIFKHKRHLGRFYTYYKLKTQTVHGSRAFSVAEPTLWNSLPADITNTASLTAFRNRLKTFLFHHTPSGCSAD